MLEQPEAFAAAIEEWLMVSRVRRDRRAPVAGGKW
jgi:hypothetical protein